MADALHAEHAIRDQLLRQSAHWEAAAARLADLNQFASVAAWRGLERYLGAAVLRRLAGAVTALKSDAHRLRGDIAAASGVAELAAASRRLRALRSRYVKTETTLDFFGDAINTRTDPDIAAVLRAADSLAQQSMHSVLEPAGLATPPVITYLDKGLGASILKAGLRLWDGGEINPVAAIKVVRHNLFRPTSLIHESGHQVAHMLDWNAELAGAIGRALPRPLDELWGSWASEIAADAFSFAHTGYGSIAALHDVVAGMPRAVFRLVPGDPHPVSYLRVLLGTAMCRHFYGAGPWDALETAWRVMHPLAAADETVAPLMQDSLPHIGTLVQVIFEQPANAFQGRPFATAVPPARVAPATLEQLERAAGGALFTSSAWTGAEGLRALALSSYRIATEPERAREWVARQRDWMLRLGGRQLAA